MSNNSSDKYDLIDQMAEEFAARYRKGERPSLQEYIDRYPELADDIRELLPALVEIEQVKEDFQGPEETSRAAAAPALRQLGDYHIVREVGHGGMGVVYEAEQLSLGRRVALKVLPQHLLRDARYKRRFEREAKAAARLHHTNIVPVYGVGEQDGLPYYAMQFIQGVPLDTVIDELQRLRPVASAATGQPPANVSVAARSLLTGEFEPACHQVDRPEPDAPVAATVDFPSSALRAAAFPDSTEGASRPRLSDTSAPTSSVLLPGQENLGHSTRWRKQTYAQSVARIGVQVADALDHAHKQGVLHRDIKPSNLLLDTHGTVWVTDFGLAKTTDQDNLTHTGDVLGTLRYMPPEAFNGQADPRSDVYALGLTLYELLALRPAFDAKDRNQLVKQVTTGEPPRLDRLNPSVPRDLVTVIHKAIEPDRGRRYTTAGDFASDLQRFIDDEPIQARRTSLAERLSRLSRHNPWVASLILAVFLLLVAVAGVGLYAYVTTARALDREETQKNAARAAEAEARAEAARNHRLRYDADMQSAAQLWESETGTARAVADLLAEHVPAPDGEDLRDFTWRYQWALLHRGVAIDGHRGEVTVCLTADGRLLTLDDAGLLRSRDKASGRTTVREDWSRLPNIRCWTFSPDRATLAMGTTDGTLHLCEVATGRRQSLYQGRAQPTNVRFSSDGRTLVSIHADSKARFWDVHAGKEVATIALQSSTCRDVALAPDGKTIILANHPDNTRLGVYRLGQEGPQLLTSHGSSVRSVSYSPDGKTIASGDGQVFLWDAATLQAKGGIVPHGGYVTTVEFSPDSNRLATGSSDGVVAVWSVEGRKRLFRGKGHTGVVCDVTFSTDGKMLASGSSDGTARTWDLGAMGEARALGGPELRSGVAWSPDGKWLATGGAVTKLWDARTEQFVRGLGPATRVTFSPDSGRLATGGSDGQLQLWDVASGRLTRTLARRAAPANPDQQAVGAVAFSPDGKLLAAGFGTPFLNPANHGQVVEVWDAASGHEVATLPHGNTVSGLAFSPDGMILATACHDHTVRLWSARAWQEVRTLRGTGRVHAVAYSPRGDVVAAGSWDGTIHLWAAASGEPLRTLKGHANMTFGLAISPDGKTLASASYDRTIKLWDVVSGRELRTIAGHTDWVYDVAFSADGDILVSSSGDHSVRLWDTRLPRVRAERALAALEGEVASRPNDPLTWIEYGRYLVAQGEARADDAFAKALEQQSKDANLWLDFGRYLGEHSRVAKADAAFTRAVAVRPADPIVWRECGRRRLQLGWLDKAAVDFARAIEAEPEDHWTWFQTAPLLLYVGEVEKYRRHRRAMLDRFGKTRDPAIAERTAKVCLLLSSPAEEWAPAAALADRACRSGADHPFRKYFQVAKALAEYRQGSFSAADERLAKIVAGNNLSWDVATPAFFVQAMAQQRQGKTGDARDGLARGVRSLEKAALRPADAAGSWHDWLIFQILRREAEALLAEKQG